MNKYIKYLGAFFIVFSIACNAVTSLVNPSTTPQAVPSANSEVNDTSSESEKKITPTIEWLTFLGINAQKNTVSYDNGNSTVVAGKDGNLYFLEENLDYDNKNLALRIVDKSGAFNIVTTLENVIDSYGQHLAIDSNGNILITGRSEVSWGTPITPLDPSLYADRGYQYTINAFIGKLDSHGNLIWNTFLPDLALSVPALDASDNIFVARHEAGSARQKNLFSLVKLNKDGIVQWDKEYQPNTTSFKEFRGFEPIKINLDSNGNIYLSGGAYPGDQEQCFIIKFSSEGDLIWDVFYGNPADMDCSNSEIDKEGNIYANGSSSSSWGNPINPYTEGASGFTDFVVMFDSDGNMLWNTFFDETKRIYNIAIGTNNNLFIAGEIYTPNGDSNGYIAQIDTQGNLLWEFSVGGDGYELITSIIPNDENHVYAIGTSDKSFGTPIYSYTSLEGLHDNFVVYIKLSE